MIKFIVYLKDPSRTYYIWAKDYVHAHQVVDELWGIDRLVEILLKWPKEEK